MNTFFKKFSLHQEKEDLETVVTSIDNGTVFRGTNLWILIFAIFVASLGLNVNSPAVIIGAMLISPLMGPIMGIGLGVGINDIALLRKAVFNYLIATGSALATSTIFFSLSPLNDAHAEILARTSPTIYDVLIALFGGFAGIVATFSKQKGNVIPGVAIATALMPPLCTAGYGLATLQWTYFFGAFYLFIINTVFIALATFIITRLLHFPYKHHQTKKADIIAHRIVWLVVLATLLPSLYFGYDMVQQAKFTKYANDFITNEAYFPNDYLLNKKINAKDKKITLIFGGKEISKEEITQLKSKMRNYQLQSASLEVNQGFAYLSAASTIDNDTQFEQLKAALAEKENKEKKLERKLDSVDQQQILSSQIFAELKAQYPSLQNAVISRATVLSDSIRQPIFLILLHLKSNLGKNEKSKIENWLKVRANQQNIKLIFEIDKQR